MQVAILGACGNAGSRISHVLAEQGVCDLTVLGRHSDRVKQLAAGLPATGNGRAHGVILKSIDPAELAPLLSSVDLLIVASATLTHTRSIAEACGRGHRLPRHQRLVE